MATLTHKLGKGIYIMKGAARYEYIPHAHSFNPPLKDFDESSGVTDVGIVNELYSYDLTDFYPGHEVLLCYSRITGPYAGGTVYQEWKRPSGQLYFAWSKYIPPLAGGAWKYLWSYTGIKKYYEIDSNGDYTVDLWIPGETNPTCTFTIANLDSAKMTFHDYNQRGYLWVEGDNLVFISHYRTKHFIKNDGVNYGSAPGKAGHIWVPSTAGAKYLCYVDASEIKRRTHNADDEGWKGYDGVGTTGHSPGYIWAQEEFNGSCLMFIDQGGKQFRISNGYLYGNEY